MPPPTGGEKERRPCLFGHDDVCCVGMHALDGLAFGLLDVQPRSKQGVGTQRVGRVGWQQALVVGWGLADEAQGRRGEDGRRSAGASASVQQPGAGLAWAGGIESHSRAAAAAFGSRLGLGVVAAASAAVGRSMDSIDSSNPPILMTILMLLFDLHNTHRRALCLALPCLGSRSRSRSHGGRSGDGRDPGAAGERAGRRV